MELFMVNPVVSFARTKDSEFIFFNAHKFKYYKFKGNEYIDFILDEMSHGCSLRILINLLKKAN